MTCLYLTYFFNTLHVPVINAEIAKELDSPFPKEEVIIATKPSPGRDGYLSEFSKKHF